MILAKYHVSINLVYRNIQFQFVLHSLLRPQMTFKFHFHLPSSLNIQPCFRQNEWKIHLYKRLHTAKLNCFARYVTNKYQQAVKGSKQMIKANKSDVFFGGETIILTVVFQ